MLLIRVALAVLMIGASAWAGSIRVAAAISLKEAMNEIGQTYQAESGIKVEFVFGASGELMGQIRNGAGIDVFISAANQQVDTLTKDGLVLPETRRIVAGNTLVLIVPADAPNAPSSFADLTSGAVTRVALGEPRTVPAGQYAMQALKSMNLTDPLRDKLIFGANVRQVLSYVERAEVSAGIVYSTDARLSAEKVKVVATAAPQTHEPVVYPAIVIKGSGDPAAAAKFLDYLATDKAAKILSAKGFSLPAASPKPPQ